jgi:hypothetical protein
MSEYGEIRARYEVDRLTAMAAELGIVRSPDTQPQRTAPGTVASDVQRYTELAAELGLSGSTPPTGAGLPSLGR